MTRSAQFWTWVVLTLVTVTSSAPSASDVIGPGEHGTEHGLYQLNATHVLLHVNSTELGHHDLAVTHDVANVISATIKPRSELHSTPTAAAENTVSSDSAAIQETGSANTGDDEDTLSSASAVIQDTGSADTDEKENQDTSAPAGAENTATSAVAQNDVKVSSDDDVTSSAPGGWHSVQTAAETGVENVASATDGESRDELKPVARADAETSSQTTAVFGDNKASALPYHTSPKPMATKDSSTKTEVSSSAVSSSHAEAPNSPPASSGISSSGATSPAVPIMNSSSPGLTDPAAGEDSSEEHESVLTAQELEDGQAEEEQTEDQKEDGHVDKNLKEEDLTEEETSSSEEDEPDSAEDRAGRKPPPLVVNGTVHEGGVASSAGISQRDRNVTIFALVMCATVGATFVVLVGLWINRIRRSDRLRRTQQEEDEEFTMFSAGDARYTGTAGGGYVPLR